MSWMRKKCIILVQKNLLALNECLLFMNPTLACNSQFGEKG